MKLSALELPARQPGLDRTLILLHGYGADANDLLALAHELDPRLRAVSLQAPLSLGGGARAWYNLQQTSRGFQVDAGEVSAGTALALQAVRDIAAKAPKPLLLGFSQGAGMALTLALAHPQLVAGVVALSGVPPHLTAGEWPTKEVLSALPVFLGHGTLDPLVPIAAGRATRSQLEAAGVPVTYREYPVGHTICVPELDDARAWLRSLGLG